MCRYNSSKGHLLTIILLFTAYSEHYMHDYYLQIMYTQLAKLNWTMLRFYIVVLGKPRWWSLRDSSTMQNSPSGKFRRKETYSSTNLYCVCCEREGVMITDVRIITSSPRPRCLQISVCARIICPQRWVQPHPASVVNEVPPVHTHLSTKTLQPQTIRIHLCFWSSSCK